MATPAHIFRLECDSARISNIVDQITGVPMALRRGESSRIQVALFQSGVLVLKTQLISVTAKLVGSSGVVRSEWNNNGTAIIDLNSVGSWRRGHDYLTAFDLTDAMSTALAAGAYRFTVQAFLVEAATGGTVYFANMLVDLMNPPVGSLPSSPPTPGPPTSWTKGESDARYAVKSEEASLDGTQDALADLAEWLDYAPGVPISYVSAGAAQGFTTAQKLQGRTNIAAALMQTTDVQTLGAGATFVPTPQVHSRFQLLLNGNITIANAAAFPEWTPGKYYEFMISQDATGGRSVAWGNLYTSPTYAAVNPEPNSITTLFARWEGNGMRIWEAEPANTPFPDMMWHTSRNMKVTGADAFSPWDDVINSTTVGNTPSAITRVTTFNGGRPAASLTGAKDLRFTGPYKGSAAAGCTVAVVFDSSTSASPQYLACLGFLGVEVGYVAASGIYIAGVGSGNRVAMPFPGLGTSGACIFIGTMRAGGGGIALDHLGQTVYNASGAMAAPVALTIEYIGSLGGANFWNGRFNQLLAWSRALRWDEMVAVRRALSKEIGI